MIGFRSTSRTGPVGSDAPAIPSSVERRLSGVQRQASGMAIAALHRAGVERPDAIIASTALGCLDDTERFLGEMHDAAGALLSPLPFMRSTHNTVAGQLALMLRCDGPNITHAQGQHGFHASLVEAMLMLQEMPHWNILLVAIDERTDLLEGIGSALDPTVRIGSGGEAFVLTGMQPHGGIARMDWMDADSSARPGRFTPDRARPVHGSLLAELLGDALLAGLREPLRIGAGSYGGTDLLIAPC